MALALHHGERVMVMSAFSSMHHQERRGGRRPNTNYTFCISASILAQIAHGGPPILCVCAARGVIHLSEQWFSAAIESLFNSCLTLADLSIDYKQFSFHIICILSVFKCLLYMCRCVGVFQIPVSTGNNKNLCYLKTLTWLLTVWTLRI